MARKIQLAGAVRRGAPVAASVLLAATPAAAAEGGLQIFPDPLFLVCLMAIFGLLILPLNKLLFSPLLRVLDERRERIEGAKGRAEQVAKEADGVLARYETEVRAAKDEAETGRRSMIESARREQADATASVRAEAEQRLAGARDEVGRSLTQARTELRAHAEELAREAASRVLGRPLS